VAKNGVPGRSARLFVRRGRLNGEQSPSHYRLPELAPAKSAVFYLNPDRALLRGNPRVSPARPIRRLRVQPGSA